MSASLFANHNTVIQWVKRVGEQLPNPPENHDIPELTQIDDYKPLSDYRCFIDECDHLVSKIAMTRIERENSRLRHYECRITP